MNEDGLFDFAVSPLVALHGCLGGFLRRCGEITLVDRLGLLIGTVLTILKVAQGIVTGDTCVEAVDGAGVHQLQHVWQ